MAGRGLTNVQCITQEVCKVILSNIWSEFVNFPETVDQMLTAILQMEDKWQFPSAFGGVDGCHIPMKCSSGGNEARKEYFNLKMFCSIVMMGIAGVDYKFLCTSLGLPGSSNDACTFQNIVGNDFLPEIQKVVKLPNGNELQLPTILLGDSAFPHHVWLQKPFGNTTLSRKQSHFNYCLSRPRMVTECAFGQLKGRWRLLYWKSEVNQHSLKVNILACIALHNIGIEKEDSINRKFDLSYDKNDNTRKSPEELRRRILKMVSSKSYLDTSKGAAILRDNICDYLWSKKGII